MRRIADSDPYTVPATIDDPAILDEITDTLQALGYAQSQTASVQSAPDGTTHVIEQAPD